MQVLSAVQSCNAIQACSAIQPCSGITAIPPIPPAADAFTNTYSVDFDGTDDYATIADANDLSFGNGSTDSTFSITAWVKMDDATGFRILAKTNSDTDAEYIFSTNGVDKLFFYCLDLNNSNRIGSATSGTLTSHEGSWTHVAATYDGSGLWTGITLYINGVSQSVSIDNAGNYTAMHNTNAAVNIGRLQWSSDFFANGKIDEVAILPSELSAGQITAIYNSGAPADLTSYSPTLWTRFEEGAGTSIADSSGNGHTATLTNGPTFSTDVPVYVFTNTRSVELNGTNQYMEANALASAVSSNNVGTFSAWIAPTDASPNTTETIMGFGDANADSKLEIHISGITQTLIRASCSITGTVQWVLSSSDLGWTNGVWHHVTVTHDGSTAKIYIDGVDISASYTVTTDKTKWLTDISGIDTFCVGAIDKNSAVTQYFDGLIDEAAYFSTELSAAQVTAIYNSGVPANLEPYSPVGWYRMGDNDGGTGTTITDQGSAGNDGTLINAPTFSTDVPT